MTPTALRLQIVRGLATMTQSTAGEIEQLFELAKPVAAARAAPPKSRREKPVGLELKLIRTLIAHPALSLVLDGDALQAFSHFGQEAAERMIWLVQMAQSLGEQGSFAALCQLVKEAGPDYDALISEIAAAPESDFEGERMWLIATVRHLKMDALKLELDQLFSAGLSSEQIGVRYREITAKQDQLRREADAELSSR